MQEEASTKTNPQSAKVYWIIVTVAVFALLGLMFVLACKPGKQENVFQSNLVLSPMISPTTPASEPVITSWKTYSNDTYNFTIWYPDGWNQQDYSSFYQNGGTLIAFSPDSLPCPTCSYVKNGFYSIRIYNSNTDPEPYSEFTKRMQLIGKNKDYFAAKMDGASGVYSGKTIAVENKGWVYEVTLDKDLGQEKAFDSKIFKQSAESLKFTNLIFN